MIIFLCLQDELQKLATEIEESKFSAHAYSVLEGEEPDDEIAVGTKSQRIKKVSHTAFLFRAIVNKNAAGTRKLACNTTYGELFLIENLSEHAF